MSPPEDSDVPACRIESTDKPVRGGGEFVLYWMTGARRLRDNFALQRARDWCRQLGKPLVILEALRAGYEYASVRHHTFILQGMAGHAAALTDGPATYLPYVEPRAGEGAGLLAALAKRACVVVADLSPVFFLPRMRAAALGRLAVRAESVDGVGLLPLSAVGRPFPTAYAFRRHLQRTLPEHLLGAFPEGDPLAGLPRFEAPDLAELRDRWPMAGADDLADPAALAGRCAIDQAVGPGVLSGGTAPAHDRLEMFLRDRLDRYGDERSHPDREAASGLSPYLHYGHLSAHRVFAAVADREDWGPDDLGKGAAGKRAGWWGMSPAAESFLDELITWRELGQGFVHNHADPYSYDGLPDWAKTTLAEHADDPRDPVYSRDEFDRSATHDEIWNAAQRQLKESGVMPNYLRMLWGKKVLHWSASPGEAMATLYELNDRYALDGRDPNSMAGISWTFGRFDRAWGPERPVFGKIRYMTSDSTRRKLKLKRWLARWGEGGGATLFG